MAKNWHSKPISYGDTVDSVDVHSMVMVVILVLVHCLLLLLYGSFVLHSGTVEALHVPEKNIERSFVKPVLNKR